MKIFINYRRRDSGAFAHLLRDRLVARFGEENVFLDVTDLQPGMHWLDQIRSHGTSAGIMLVVVGAEWETALRERMESALADGTADMVKQEIELALTRGSGVEVVPVLVGDVLMPEPENLPRSLRPLAYLQAAPVRLTELDRDLEDLGARLEEIGQRRESPKPSVFPPPRESPSADTLAPLPAIDTPDDAHYDAVLNFLLATRSMVPVLGPHAVPGPGGLSAEQGEAHLAGDVAETLGLHLAPNEMARVAQQVLVTAGSPDLHDAIRRVLGMRHEPSPVHRFLARFPGLLEEAGQPHRYQMIVTTNYDGALERAFDAEGEPYDLAVYMANGSDQGRFVHFPFDRDPEPIVVPNRFGKLPIEDDGELRRTLIVKVNGAVDGTSGGYHWRQNYVVTEDQYIEYLSHNSVETLVPIQILDKLTSSHCLFLGYPLVSWNLRVFLRRIWQGGRIDARSWAVEESPEPLESDYWRQLGVELVPRPLVSYVDGLTARLGSRLAASS
jgi:hypothetical protein